jgi:hypothetical protein
MKILKCISIILILSSCAAWRLEETNPTDKFPTNLSLEGKKPKTSISFKRFEVKNNSKLDNEGMAEERRKEVLALIETAYKESKLFNIVDEDSPNKDMSIEVDITTHFSGGTGMKWLTALTLYLVPRKTVEEITVTTRFLDKKGELVGMVEKIDKAITWHQLFMIFALPFSSTPNTVVTETILDLNKASIMDAFEDGYFTDINQ